jgi:type IV conjugative transfer system protein TraE
MHINRFLSRQAAILGENRLLKFFTLILGLAWIANTAMVYYALQYSRVVLVPPGLDRKASTTGRAADDQYLTVQGRYLAGLVWSFSPDTVQHGYEDVLKVYAPEAYASARKDFYAVVQDVTANHISSTFRIREVTIDQAASLITISGVRQQYLEQRLADTAEKALCIKYQFKDGMFQVLEIREKNGR